VVDDPATVTVAANSVTVGVIVMEDTAFTTSGTVYAVVPDENAGVRVPELNTKLFKVATLFTVAAVLVTATVYVVLADVPSCGEPITVIVVADPAASIIAPDADPELTVTACTVTVAPLEVTVGVTVTDSTLLGTADVYEVVPDAKATFSEPSLSIRALRVLTVLSAAVLVTATV
jgi:hypothetical protein